MSLQQRLQAFLAQFNTLTLATVDAQGSPHACAVFYAVDDDLTLYFLSEAKTSHAQHIGSGARVAITVESNNQDWKAIQGVQMHGWAMPCDQAQQVRARQVYAGRYPFIATTQILAGPLAKAGYYQFTPHWIRWIDNTLGFGHKEEWTIKHDAPA